MTPRSGASVPQQKPTQDAETIADEIECVTQHEREPAGPAYLAVCTGRAELIAVSRFCPDATEGECGGHSICRACYELGVVKGLIKP